MNIEELSKYEKEIINILRQLSPQGKKSCLNYVNGYLEGTKQFNNKIKNNGIILDFEKLKNGTKK